MSISKNPFGCTAAEAVAYQSEQKLRANYPEYVEKGIREQLTALIPPSNNMGGKLDSPPLFLPHCEKQAVNDDSQATKIDWLGFTAVQDLPTIHLAVEVMFPDCTFHPLVKGMPGYPRSESILWNGQQIGLIGFGAAHDRVFVSLPGTGCSAWAAPDIRRAYDVLVLLGARISRVDVALDFFNGERTYDHALFCFHKGDFKRRKGGPQPYKKEIGAVDDGKNLGRTLYVGRRDGEVMARIYEKGLELFENMPSAYKTLSLNREVEYVQTVGPVPFADTWLRVEIEFKRVEDERPVPLEILIERDSYFAGAFPYCADVLKDSSPVRPTNLPSDKQVCLIKLLAAARTSYGSLIHSLSRLGYSHADIVDVLSNGQDNKRLRSSGVLAMLENTVSTWKANNPDWDIPL